MTSSCDQSVPARRRTFGVLLVLGCLLPLVAAGLAVAFEPDPMDTVPEILGPMTYPLAAAFTGINAALAFATWWLARRRWRAVACAAGMLLVISLLLHPLFQIAGDTLIARPSAERMKLEADELSLLGKDFAFVSANLGEPDHIKVQTPVVVKRSTQEITIARPPYTRLAYGGFWTLPLGTRFLVFLNGDGLVTGYRVKWERAPMENWRAHAAED